MRPLVGRSQELEAASRLFDDGSWLVSIAGPCGIGKSHLAREIAIRHEGIVVELEGAKTLAVAARAVLEALRDRVALPRRVRGWAALSIVIQSPECPLIVLDGCDRIGAVLAETLAALDVRAGRVRVVTTSRIPILDEDAATLFVGPLEVDDALALFEMRARARGIAMATGARDDVRAIVSMVGGSPLAIDLAVDRLRARSASDLAARMRESPIAALFGRATRGRPRAVLDRLTIALAAASTREQRAAERLAAFGGPVDVDWLSAILERSDEEARDTSLALVDHALGHLAHDGPTRTFQLDRPTRWVAERQAQLHNRWEASELLHAKVVLGACAPDGASFRTFDSSRLDELMSVVRRGSTGRASTALVGYAVDAALLLAEHGSSRPDVPALVETLEQYVSDPVRRISLARAGAAMLLSRDRVEAAMAKLGEVPVDLPSPEERARCLELRCVLMRRRRQFEDAVAAGDTAVAIYRAIGSRRIVHALGALGAVLVESGDHTAALERFGDVATEATRVGDARAELLAIGFQGHALQDLGRFAEAIVAYERAATGFAGMGDERLGAIYEGYAATAAEEDERYDDAARGYASAAERLGTVGAAGFASLFRACHEALSGQEPAIRSIRAEDPGIEAAIRLHERRSAIARGTQPTTNVTTAVRLRELSDDVRFALRRLASVWATRAPAGAQTLYFDAGWAALDDEAPIDLRSRRVLHRLLEHLVAGHLAAPGRGVSAPELLRAGWGDERVSPASAAHRLRVAISELRTKGLAPVLRHDRSGYALTPTVVVRFARPGRSADGSDLMPI